MKRVAALLLLILFGGICAAPVWAAAPAQLGFDHLTTGFELTGSHRDVACESCHTGAVFKGTPRSCVACHATGTRVGAMGKTSSHILSS